MRIFSLGRFHQLIDNVCGRCLVRVAHAEVDNIFSARTRRRFQIVYDIENIGRQALDSAELFHFGR